MLNRNIHIAYEPHGGYETYFVATLASEHKRINSAEDVIATNTGKSSKRIYYVVVGGSCVNVSHRTIERTPNGSMRFPCAEVNHRTFDLTTDQRSEVLSKGWAMVARSSNCYAFIDLVAYKNFIFSLMNEQLEIFLKQEVARERADRNADRMWTELENKDFGTTPSGEKQHTIDEYLTSDDEWWLSLNDETKKQIRAEWE